MEAVSTIFHRGLTIEIHQDSDPMSPRKQFDHLGTMVCWHRRSHLGDRQWTESEDFEKAVMSDQVTWNRSTCENDYKYDRWERENMGLPKHGTLDKDYIYLPLYIYDHSGITMSTGAFSCPWDSGQVGFIFAEKEKVKKEYGWKVLNKARSEIITKLLESEVVEYDKYLTGEVYGFIVKRGEEELDSCWGYYGMEDVTTAGKEAAESVENHEKNATAKSRAEETL